MRSHKNTGVRSVIMWARLAFTAALVLSCSLAGCSFADSPGPTNLGPFSDLMRDIQAADITLLEAAEGPSENAMKGELYLRVIAAEGQDAGAIADKLVSLVQGYRAQLHLQWLHVVIASTEGFYDHTFDLVTGSPTST